MLYDPTSAHDFVSLFLAGSKKYLLLGIEAKLKEKEETCGFVQV